MNFHELDPDEAAKVEREDAHRAEERERRRQDREAEQAAIRAARERYEEAVAEDDYIRPRIAGLEGARMDAR